MSSNQSRNFRSLTLVCGLALLFAVAPLCSDKFRTPKPQETGIQT